ncbi:MAG TPA: YceD family protein [Acetobacteraceae bacterium]
MTPELHRPLVVDRVPSEGLEQLVEATKAECAALARRLMVPELRSLSCRFRLSPESGGRVLAEGDLRAVVVQTCVVTLDDFPSELRERFRLRFVPAGEELEDDDPESEDEIPYEGASIDLGEAAAEQLALALDPYPRKPGAELPEIVPEEDASPFAALARMKRKE